MRGETTGEILVGDLYKKPSTKNLTGRTITKCNIRLDINQLDLAFKRSLEIHTPAFQLLGNLSLTVQFGSARCGACSKRPGRATLR